MSRAEVTEFLRTTIYEHLLGDRWWGKENESKYFEMVEKIEGPAIKALCEIFGHEVIMDQCCKPEHDYCVYCEQPRPGEAPR